MLIAVMLILIFKKTSDFHFKNFKDFYHKNISLNLSFYNENGIRNFCTKNMKLEF